MSRTAKDLADWLRSLESRATPGPWSITCEGFETEADGNYRIIEPSTIPEILTVEMEDGFHPSQNDNVFIAHLRNNLPLILEALDMAGSHRLSKPIKVEEPCGK